MKRAHDRNGRGVAPLLYLLSTLTILAVDMLPRFGIIDGVESSAPAFWTSGAASIVLLVTGVWMLITLGFLRGTPGANRYGPSPYANVDYQAPRID